MKTFASRVANLRCPKCDRVQSLWQASTTRKNPVLGRINAFFLCENCQTKLQMSNKTSFGVVMLSWLAHAVLGILVLVILIACALAISDGSWMVVPALIVAIIATQISMMRLHAKHVSRLYSLERIQ